MFEISDMDLLMYIDGLAEPEVIAQIEQDDTIRARVAALENQQKMWISRLYRRDCPETIILGEYHLGRLHVAKKKAIENHLTLCLHCREELAELANFVGEAEDKPVSLVGQIEKIFAQLISGVAPTRSSRFTFEAGMRGGGSDSYQYEAGSSKIALEVQEDSANPGFQALVGIIEGLEAEDYEVSLWQAGEVQASAKVDDLGGFMIGSLEPGEYQLIIHGPKVEIHVQSFVV